MDKVLLNDLIISASIRTVDSEADDFFIKNIENILNNYEQYNEKEKEIINKLILVYKMDKFINYILDQVIKRLD